MKNKFVVGMLFVSFLLGCRGKDETTDFAVETGSELAQQVSDVMSGVDESAGSTGSYAMMNDVSEVKYFASRIPVNFLDKVFTGSKAFAQSCFGFGFSTCSGSQIVRDFASCTVGQVTFTGTVTLGFSNNLCRLDNVNDTVSRNPNYTMTHSSGYSLSVAKVNTTGQLLTLASGTGSNKVFSLANDGVRRTLVRDGKTLYDVTTLITSAISVTGSSRSNRILNGGTVRLQNNLTSEQCDIVPAAVTWTAGCTCATSGVWEGTCQQKGSYKLTIKSCGTAHLEFDGVAKDITLSRCSST